MKTLNAKTRSELRGYLARLLERKTEQPATAEGERTAHFITGAIAGAEQTAALLRASGYLTTEQMKEIVKP